jgi:multisubunit Na+/H+ antiporter MnhG subunit
MRHWSFSTGDPTFMGWIVTFAYLAAGALCLRAAGAAASKELSFWRGAALCLLLLGLNKQLDLQTLLIDVARQWARAGGWYQHRRIYQAIFIAAIALAGVAGIWKLAKTFRSSDRPVKAAILGLSLTLLFVLIRAASFHHVDQMLRLELLGARMHWLLEPAGIFIVAMSASAYRRKTWINGGG